MKLSTVQGMHNILMLLGHRAGCHQMPSRSFFWKGYQFPVCARCTGVLCGYCLSIPFYLHYRSNLVVCLILAGIMLLDWLIQFLGIRESNNIRRFFTGICGGYSVMTLQIMIIFQIFHFIFS